MNGLTSMAVRAMTVGGLLCSIVGLAWLIQWAGVSPGSFVLLAGWLVVAAVAVPLMRSRTKLWIAVAIAAAIGLRLFMAWVTHGSNTTQSDAMIYEQIARNILAGNGIVSQELDLPPFRALYPPAYPVLLAGAYAIIPVYGPLALNTLIQFCGAAVLYRMAGAAAAYLFLIWPSFVVSAPIPNKEGLLCLAFLLSVLPILKGKGSARDAMLFGASVGLIGLTQPALATLPPLLSLILLRDLGLRTFIRFALIAAAALVVVMLPWWVRNYLVFGAFVPLTTTMGLNLHIAVLGWDMPAWVKSLPERELSATAGRLAIDWVVANPAIYLMSQARQAFISFGLDHAYLEILGWLSIAPRISPQSFALVLQVPFVLLWAASLRKGPPRMQWILLLTVTHFALVNFWFQLAQRHRVVLVPLLLAWAISVGRNSAINIASEKSAKVQS